MYLARTGAAQQGNQPPGGGAAHKRIVEQHDAFAADHRAIGRQLEFDPHVPQRLGWLDEGAADIAVLDQPHFTGQPALLAVAHCRREGGIRHPDHNIGRKLPAVPPGEQPAGFFAHRVDVHAAKIAVRPGKIHILHRAQPVLPICGVIRGFQPLIRKLDNFARLDVPDKMCADVLEGAGFARQTEAAVDLAERQWSQTVFVPHRIQAFFGQD